MKLVFFVFVFLVALVGCGDPSDGNTDEVVNPTGMAGSSGKNTNTGGMSGTGAAGADQAVSICSKIACDPNEICVVDQGGFGRCISKNDGMGGSSGSSATGSSGSTSTAGSAGASDSFGNAGTAGKANSAGSAGASDSFGNAGTAGKANSAGSTSDDVCSTSQAGAWCAVAQSGVVCGSLICNGVWTPTGSNGNAGNAGSAGASGSSGSAGTAGTAGAAGSNVGPVVGELGEFSLTISLKESGVHSLKLYAFESNGSIVWGTDPNFTATDAKFTWKVGAHWGAYVQLNGSVDTGASQLCNNSAATEPMWATYKGSDGIVRALKAPIAISEGGGCHLRFMLESCGSDADPDCDGKTGAQGDCDQSIGKGQATYPGALESANDTDDLNCDGSYDPSVSDLGQVYVRMTGMPHGVTARFYDDLNWVDGGIAMTEVSNGVYDTVLLSTKPKTFYVTWTPSVNGKNSSAGLQGGICISNVSTVSVFNAETNTVATTAALSLNQDCHWFATYN
ncbi:hypothetical protein IT408_00050 [Candidatus Uhrbacteria bacterium]|nr:hypothetical protein [Candidatus Uhrbacteria bacterium]